MKAPEVPPKLERRAVSATTATFQRKPLIISGNSMSSGDMSTTFKSDSAESLMRTYLVWVREMRGQRRDPAIHLRSEDITVIASHLGVDEELVLGGLLDLMGQTRTQRSTAMALLAAGALTIVLSGTVVNTLSDDGISVGLGRLVDAVQSVVGLGDTTVGTQVGGQTVTGDATVVVPAITPAPTLTAQELLTEAAIMDPTVPLVQSTITLDPTAGVQEPVSVGTATDGSTVAVAAPLVPPVVADEPVSTGTATDGSTVGVAAPLAPPVVDDEPMSTAVLPDGSTVGVAGPLVPPVVDDTPTGTGTAADGSTIGVVAPPVPVVTD
jgi:hypothetical protein